MVSDMIRNMLNLGFCILGGAFFLGITLLLVVANYMACQVSFELLGYDRLPLYQDKLLGGLFGAFLPGASLTHLMGFVVSAVISLGLFIAFRSLFHLFELIEGRQRYLGNGDRESARAFARLILWQVVQVVVLAVPLGFAMAWDVQLFRYRSIAGAFSIEDPALATQINTWGLQIQENADLWVVSLAEIGAWGYLGVTALSCLGLEWIVKKTGIYWSRLMMPLDEAFDPAFSRNDNQAFIGHGEEGRPVYDDAACNDDTDGSVTEGVRRGETLQHREDPSGFQEGGSGEKTPNGQALRGQRQSDASGSTRSEGGFRQDRGAEPSRRVPVIGGAENETISLREAIEHPERYWVDESTHEVWDRSFRDALFENPPEVRF